MKIVRYGAAGEERPGAIDGAGKLRSLYPLLRDFTGEMLAPESLAMLAAIDVEKLPLVEGNPRLGVPVAGIQQIIAIGANYADHCAEGGIEIPKEPMVFAKSAGSLCGCEDPTVIPESAGTLDWEIELALLIGTGGRDIAPEDALKHVAGYSTAIDFSERDWMLRYGLQLQIGKSLDTFTPLGPWFVTADEIQDSQSLDLGLDVNGEQRQRGNTAQMVFSVAQIIAFVSQYQTLRPGDLIVTGTPGGVGHCAKPPHYLKIGDRVTAGVAGLGDQRHEVRARHSL
jgi:2-keto-4-pentenoate hydratase/2-oxohepta-3-ene-1,7-dioic acid hydratase in catechol pathway